MQLDGFAFLDMNPFEAFEQLGGWSYTRHLVADIQLDNLITIAGTDISNGKVNRQTAWPVRNAIHP